MKRQYMVTERAHFMCPNMHFGMVLEVEKSYSEENLRSTLERMAEAHPFLKSLIAYEEGTDHLFYKVMPQSQIELILRDNEQTLWEDYQKILCQDWNVFEKGLLKVYAYPMKRGMKVMFVVHHLLVDGRGALEIAEEFANDYVGNVKPVYAEERLLEDISDLPPNSQLSGISKLMIRLANAWWEKESHRVTYEQYSSFVKTYVNNHRVEYQTYEVEKEGVIQMSQLCRENDITINDYLMAEMFLKTRAENIIIAADIRKNFSGYQKGALGNYSTAMGIKCKAKTRDVVELAKEVHKAVKKHMAKNKALMLVLACYFEISPTLLDAAAISALGGFESKAGRLVGQGMFHMGMPASYSITNLGRVENENMKSLLFIPPASPAAKFTLGIVTLNGVMQGCSSRNE